VPSSDRHPGGQMDKDKYISPQPTNKQKRDYVQAPELSSQF